MPSLWCIIPRTSSSYPCSITSPRHQPTISPPSLTRSATAPLHDTSRAARHTALLLVLPRVTTNDPATGFLELPSDPDPPLSKSRVGICNGAHEHHRAAGQRGQSSLGDRGTPQGSIKVSTPLVSTPYYSILQMPATYFVIYQDTVGKHQQSCINLLDQATHGGFGSPVCFMRAG